MTNHAYEMDGIQNTKMLKIATVNAKFKLFALFAKF